MEIRSLCPEHLSGVLIKYNDTFTVLYQNLTIKFSWDGLTIINKCYTHLWGRLHFVYVTVRTEEHYSS
jgi:hypothetical protein